MIREREWSRRRRKRAKEEEGEEEPSKHSALLSLTSELFYLLLLFPLSTGCISSVTIQCNPYSFITLRLYSVQALFTGMTHRTSHSQTKNNIRMFRNCTVSHLSRRGKKKNREDENKRSDAVLMRCHLYGGERHGESAVRDCD